MPRNEAPKTEYEIILALARPIVQREPINQAQGYNDAVIRSICIKIHNAWTSTIPAEKRDPSIHGNFDLLPETRKAFYNQIAREAIDARGNR
jgi:hypothetical protein